jgi:hypothetical protein
MNLHGGHRLFDDQNRIGPSETVPLRKGGAGIGLPGFAINDETVRITSLGQIEVEGPSVPVARTQCDLSDQWLKLPETQTLCALGLT